jgi:hypothetical protein
MRRHALEPAAAVGLDVINRPIIEQTKQNSLARFGGRGWGEGGTDELSLT